MQDKKVTATEMVMISVPLDMLMEAGIEDDSVIEIFTDEDRIIIRKAVDLSDFECDGNCADCPLDDRGCPFDELKEEQCLCPDCRAKLKKRGKKRHD